MPYSLDDAHEALAGAVFRLDRIDIHRIPLGSGAIAALVPCRFALRAALDAIEADLPEPCPECGDDHPCAHRTLLSW